MAQQNFLTSLLNKPSPQLNLLAEGLHLGHLQILSPLVPEREVLIWKQDLENDTTGVCQGKAYVRFLVQ